MKNVVRTQGVGRLLLKVLAIGSALTFLAVVMVNACANRAAPTYAAPTKAAPVVHPPPASAPAQAPAPPPARAVPPPTLEADDIDMRAPATKSGPVFRPRRRAPP